ncbi:MAG TPA: hypothetical protein VMQ56_12610 [Terracidiphilus sp.]|nr:hypothetical protein [Terracidiphilus sp.]
MGSLLERIGVMVGGKRKQEEIVVDKRIVGIQSRCFPQLRLRIAIFLCGKQIEAKIPMRRGLRGVKPNRIAIVACGLVRMIELSLRNPKQVLDRGIPGSKAMRLFQPGQGLIEMTLSNQSHPFVQRLVLRGEETGRCEGQEGKRDDPIPGHCFAPSSA